MSTSGRSAELSPQAPPRLRRRPSAVLLDAGNTLLHLDYELLAGMLRSRADVAPGEGKVEARTLTPETVRRAEWRARVRLDPFLAMGTVRSDALPASGVGSTESSGTFRRYMTFLCEEAGLMLPPDVLSELFEELADYQQAHNLWSHAHPFAHRVLHELKDEGCRLAVVSNAAGDVAELLARHNLAELFDAIIDSSLVGVEKPDPAIFQLALRKLDVQPEAALHVGDLPAVDVAGAQAAGIEAVLIDPLGSWSDVDCVRVRDLTALPELVRRAPRQL
jgi:putative hydrolase of the HAD superfamily